MTQRRKPRMPTDPAVRAEPAGAQAARAGEIAEERLADWLVQLVGRQVRDTIDPEDPAHAQYFAWLAEEARAAQTPAERAQTAREADVFARDMMQRLRETSAVGAGSEDAVAAPETTGGSVTAGVRGVYSAPPVRSPRGSMQGKASVNEAARAGYAARFALGVAAGIGRELWDEPVDAWVELPEGVALGPHVALTVRGASMTPLLHDGDTLLVRVGSDVTVGDVIVARRPEHGYVVKRVARVNRESMVLASDNAAFTNVTVPRDPALIVGVVVLRWCTHAQASM
jgi:phage repressor protein C with HTH and peptisase S24 domain